MMFLELNTEVTCLFVHLAYFLNFKSIGVHFLLVSGNMRLEFRSYNNFCMKRMVIFSFISKSNPISINSLLQMPLFKGSFNTHLFGIIDINFL